MRLNMASKPANEFYPTPRDVVSTLLKHLRINQNDTFLEPCRGAGAIFDSINLPESQKFWAELSDGVDYLTTPFEKVDLIITNPPFSLTCEFLEKSLSELKEGGTLIYLQRVNFLGSIKRVPFWDKVGLPNKTPIIIPRPAFVSGKTDSTEYMWYVYDHGNRVDAPLGLSHWLSGSHKLVDGKVVKLKY